MGRFEDLLRSEYCYCLCLYVVRRFFGLTKPQPSVAYLSAASVTVACPGAEAGAGGGGEPPVPPLPPVQTPARHHAGLLLGTR